MSIMDAFRNAFGSQPQQPQNTQIMPPGSNQLQVPQNNQQQQQPNPALDANGNPQLNNGEPTPEPSPLDPFKDLWTIDPKQTENQPQSLTEFSLAVDPAKVNAAVKNIDFTKAISSEILQKINAGGPEAMSALLVAMNAVGQQAVAQATTVNSKIVESSIRSSGANMEKLLPGMVRNHTISNTLREDNPLFTDPATAPMMAVLEAQFSQKFPNATAQQIKEHTQKYMIGFAERAASVYKVGGDAPNSKQGNSQTNGDYDWSKEPV